MGHCSQGVHLQTKYIPQLRLEKSGFNNFLIQFNNNLTPLRRNISCHGIRVKKTPPKNSFLAPGPLTICFLNAPDLVLKPYLMHLFGNLYFYFFK